MKKKTDEERARVHEERAIARMNELRRRINNLLRPGGPRKAYGIVGRKK